MARRQKVGRNEACGCGSGRKYKHCCAKKDADRGSQVWLLAVAGVVGAALLLIAVSVARQDDDSGPRRVWSSEHGHYHDLP